MGSMHRTQPLRRLMVKKHACLFLDSVLRHSAQPMQDSAKQYLELKDLAVAQQLQKEEDSSPKSVLYQFASSSTHELAPMQQVQGDQLLACKELVCTTYVSTDATNMICVRGATCHTMLYASLCQALAVVTLLVLPAGTIKKPQSQVLVQLQADAAPY